MTVEEYSQYKFLGTAFNSSIAKENKKKFPKRNCTWKTGHELAKEGVIKLGYDFKVDRKGFKASQLNEILGIKTAGDFEIANATDVVYKVFCNSSLKKFDPEMIKKAAHIQKNTHLLMLNDAYIEAGCHYANKLWELQIAKKVRITFDFYFKYYEYLELARELKYDFVLLDEAQDSTATTMSIITQIPAKKIYVGDEHQSIYGFRGTLNAMNFAKEIRCLSTTFRYTPEIAKIANEILSKYKGETIPIKSKVDYAVALKDREFAYLTRNNSTMISKMVELIEQRRSYKTIKSPDEIFATAEALFEFKKNKKINAIEKPDYAYLNNYKDIEEVMEYAEMAKDNELLSAFGVQKIYGTRLSWLKTQAKINFKSKEKPDVYLATGHTSKGLEWGSVELAPDFPDIQRLLKDAKIKSRNELMKLLKEGDATAASIVQEINLRYVAITRAKHTVNVTI